MKRINKRKKRKILKNIKMGMLVVFFFVLIFRGVMVDAGINDSHIEKNRFFDVYAVTNFMGSDHLYYLNMYTLNGELAYCIELGVDITSDIYNSTYDFSLSNLNSRKIEHIRNISYFGYGYLNHTDYRYYMASQEIMWEYLNNIEVEWTNVLDVNGERISIDSYKKEILSLVNDYERGVSLSGYNSDMDVRIGDVIKLSDVNENLEYYDVVSGEHNNVNVVGNDIYIKFDTDYVGKDNITLKRKKVYENDSLLYYQGNSQKLISNGNIDDEIKLEFNIKGKSMFIQLKDNIDIKHNNQFDYYGIAFQLYDDKGKYYGFIYCDKLGKIYVDNLPYGKYKASQARYSNGYLMTYNTQELEFYDDSVKHLIVKPIYKDVKIIKLYGEGDDLYREGNVSFDIYNIDGSYYDSVVTDDYGIGNIKLPYGDYVVKQKSSAYGYSMVDDFSIDNKIYDDYKSITYTLVDEIIKSNLIINTKDMDGNFIVEDGFSYKIFKDNELLVFDGESEFESVDGKVLLSDRLVYGDYVLEVINNNNNYKSIVERVDFSINSNSNFVLNDGNLSLELDVKYDVVKGSVKINGFKEEVKYNDNSYYYEIVKDNNVSLELIVDSDVNINNNVIYSKGDKILDTVVNNGEGLVEDLYLGKYCLVNNYYNECFEIVDGNVVLVELNKKLDKGGVIIHNVSNEGLDIMGTVMELYDKDDRVIYIGSTNDNGMIKVNDLMYGEYCFRQKIVGNEYLLNKDDICFVIDNEKNVELEVINKRVNRKIVMVPDTFSDKKSIRKLIVMFGLLLGGGIFYKVKIRNRNN